MLTENQLFANRYRLVKRLGQGAFSEVWKAEDTKAGDLTVALKVYAPDKGLDEDGAKVFSDEFAIVFNVHHSNLLTPNYFDEENNSPYLVLPFCEQGSSLKLVGKMDERQAAKFMRDVSSALAYLHAKDIIHQDIKPDNVLIDGEDNYMVTDFGISTRIRSTLRRSVGDKKSAGTMAYMGPERFGRNPKPIKASDMWSLGATIYELMSGDVPYGDMGGGMQTAGAIVPELEGNYSAELKQLVEQCLAKEPWDRPTAVQLRDICDGYLRTGAWDLSSLNKSSTHEPENPRKAAGRPTERKVFAPENDQTTKETPAKETFPKPKPEKPKPDSNKMPKLTRRKRLPWIIGGTAAVVVLAVVLGVTINKNKSVTLPDGAAGEYVVNGVSFTMKHVQGGTFQMDATSEQDSNAYYSEKPEHSVTVSDFCMGETEVTQALWKAVMGRNPSHFKGDNLPVERVSWNDCQQFIQKLNQLTGKTFRLPTEAEWEYAARGGNKSSGYEYSGSNTLGNVAWYDGNSGRSTHPVKGKQANELGLYDMSGNVWEWCSDWWGSYSSSSQTNPTGPSSGSYRVLRGGSWCSRARDCWVSYRYCFDPDLRINNSRNPLHRSFGFRLALSK